MKYLFFVVPLAAFGMEDLNNNNNNLATAWPIPSQKSTYSSQECLAKLTPEQKIAQLFMPGMEMDNPDDIEKVTELIKKYALGGVLLNHSATSNNAVTSIQNLHDSNTTAGHPLPLWIAMDAEWGPAMRLMDAICFPKAMTLAATSNFELIAECSKEIGIQLHRLGIDINFAPVLDVNNNSKNPVIGMRSFGEEPDKVALMALMYWTGAMENVLCCAKHFPGHGDTDVDSHLALPVMNYPIERLHGVELKPFKRFIKMQIPMIMVGHLLIPALDERLPASVSPKVIDDLLRKELGYQGLVITDGLKMDAVSKKYNTAELALLAFKAGNDIILQLDDTAAGIEALIDAHKRGEIKQEQIDERFMRIWSTKSRYGLLEAKNIWPENYDEKLFHTPYAYDLQRRLYEAAMTLVNNDNNMLPIDPSMKKETLFIAIGGAECFSHKLEKKHIAVQRLDRIFDREKFLTMPFKDFKNIIISIAGMNKFAKDSYGISEDAQYLCQYVQGLKDLQYTDEQIYQSPKRTMLVLFGMPYAASSLEHQGLLVAYEDNKAAQRAAAKVVLGKYAPTGKLPVSIGTQYPVGTGVSF